MFFPDCYLHLPMFQIWNIDWCLIFGHLSDFLAHNSVHHLMLTYYPLKNRSPGMLFTYLRSFSFAHPQPVLLLAGVLFQQLLLAGVHFFSWKMFLC